MKAGYETTQYWTLKTKPLVMVGSAASQWHKSRNWNQQRKQMNIDGNGSTNQDFYLVMGGRFKKKEFKK